MPEPSPPALAISAVIVVRDEAGEIGDCVAALAGFVDEVLVYDTGSTDDTVPLARAAGATVVDGFWDGDHGRSRNDAADAAAGEWLLVVDADERVAGDPAELRALLADDAGAGVAGGPARPDARSVLIHDTAEDGLGGGYHHWVTRLVRRGTVRWVGRVHERPVRADGLPPDAEVLPAHVLGIEHRGYADPEAVRRRGERNAHLAEAELHALHRLRPHDRAGIADALLALGRSLVTAGRPQDAVDTFETLRELAPRTPQWMEGTDYLARLLLGGGGFDEAVVLLSEQLREVGGDPRYCDWLRAQGLAQLGSPNEALELVRGVDELVDPGGRRHDLGQVLEMRALMAALVGERQEALDALAQAMAHHGRVRGRGRLLLDLWAAEADHSPADLARLVRKAGDRHLLAIARELRAAGGEGPDVALALGA
jgi:hypothetical protein